MSEDTGNISIKAAATVAVHKIKDLNKVITDNALARVGSSPSTSRKSVEDLRVVDSINYDDDDDEVDPEGTIQVHRSFHGIESGLLTDYGSNRDPNGPERTPTSEDGACNVVLTCLADIFSLKYYYK